MSVRLTLTAVAATAAVLAGSPASAAHRRVSHAALGDSYSSGVGAGPYDDATCKRSPQSYAPRLVKHARSFTFLACGGATTAQVTAQAAAIPAGTTLVTFTAGGNDIGFSQSLSVCLAGTDQDCAAVAEQAKLIATTELPTRLDTLYATVRAAAPWAEVLAGGYPRLFETRATCATVPLSRAKRITINHAVNTLNRTIRQRARANGATYVDAAAAFAGHGICAADPWINALVPDGAFHPNATGYAKGYLRAFKKAHR